MMENVEQTFVYRPLGFIWLWACTSNVWSSWFDLQAFAPMMNDIGLYSPSRVKPSVAPKKKTKPSVAPKKKTFDVQALEPLEGCIEELIHSFFAGLRRDKVSAYPSRGFTSTPEKCWEGCH